MERYLTYELLVVMLLLFSVNFFSNFPLIFYLSHLTLLMLVFNVSQFILMFRKRNCYIFNTNTSSYTYLTTFCYLKIFESELWVQDCTYSTSLLSKAIKTTFQIFLSEINRKNHQYVQCHYIFHLQDSGSMSIEWGPEICIRKPSRTSESYNFLQS